jgi:hypothetical protein
MMIRLTRRAFAATAMAGGILLALAVLPAGTRLPGAARWSLCRARRMAWNSVLPPPAVARPIARLYLAAAPAERRADVLLAALQHAAGAGHHSGEALASALQDAMARDFDSGDTLDLDGWLLSRTECRLCALAALI